MTAANPPLPQLAHDDDGPIAQPFTASRCTSRPSPRAWWTGAVLSSIAIAFLGLDTVVKLLLLVPAIESTTELGYAASVVLPLGIVELVCLIAYWLPRTSFLGAILWTGYLGGAVATHVRVGNPWLSHVLFPVYIAALLWAGLALRTPALRDLLLSRRPH